MPPGEATPDIARRSTRPRRTGAPVSLWMTKREWSVHVSELPCSSFCPTSSTLMMGEAASVSRSTAGIAGQSRQRRR